MVNFQETEPVRAFSRRSMPSVLIRGWDTGSRKENAPKQESRASVLIQSEPIMLWAADPSGAMGLGQHLIGMAVDLDVAPDPQHPAIGVDQNRGPRYSKEGPAIHRFFAPDPIRLQHGVLLIRGERNRQLVLVAKGLLGLGRVGGDPEHRGSALGKGLGQAGEVDRLF